MRILLLCILAWLFLAVPVYAAPPPVKNYARLPSVLDAALSPDGTTLAIILENKGQYAVRVFNLENLSGSHTRAVGIAKESRPLWLKWVNNDRLILSVQDTQFIERVIVYTGFLHTMSKDLKDSDVLIKPSRVRNTAGSNMKQGAGARQFNNVVIDFPNDDPDHIMMTFAEEQFQPPAVHLVDVENGTYDLVRRQQPGIQKWITDTAGIVRVGQDRRDVSGNYDFIIREANGDRWESYENYPGLSANETVLGFTQNTHEMIVARYGGKDTLGLYVYDLNQKQFSKALFQHDKYDVRNVIWSADGKKPIGAEFISDKYEQAFFDPDVNSNLQLIQ